MRGRWCDIHAEFSSENLNWNARQSQAYMGGVNIEIDLKEKGV